VNPNVPEGYVLVPIEPTREMWAAMGDAVVGYKQRHHDKVTEEIWSAGLKAAPPPPQGTTPVLSDRVAELEAQVRELNARNVELNKLAYAWMVAHDDRAAGRPVRYPQQGDVPKPPLTGGAETHSAVALCEDCPAVGYPTDKTRCTPCPRRALTGGAS
jgi:hypothetical protein